MKYQVIAVDFDGTIARENWPQVGDLIHKAKRVLKAFKERGGTILIWTCREGEYLEDARRFLIENDIPFDKLNSNSDELLDRYGIDSRKLGADMYIDDKDPLSQYHGYVDWDLVEMILLADI